MSDPAETSVAGAIPDAAEGRGVRVALSPYVFRGMLVGMAAVAVMLYRVTGSREVAWRFAKARSRTLARLLRVRVQVHGREHLKGLGPVVFIANHQSHLDILTLLGCLPGQTRFAAKRELWRHPVVGAVLDALGMLPIDRDHPERAIETLGRVEGGSHSFVVFPEGRRSPDGRLGEFKKGAFLLAIRLGLPVVPVVCRGTRRLMPRGSRLVVLPGDVEIVIGEPIPTERLGYEDREPLAQRVREAIEREHTGW